MPTIPVFNLDGETVGEITLSEAVFGVPMNAGLLHQSVVRHQANQRLGTASTKTRSEVSGGGRKPWRQKGTGRARQGSIRAPQWRGGGVVFGPTPRSYKFKVNRKVVINALRSLLVDRFQNNNLVVVDKIELQDFKTKSLVEVLKNLNAVDKKVIIITNEEDFNLSIAGRNIPNVYVQTRNHLSVYDLINANMYIATEEVIKEYEKHIEEGLK